MLIEADVTSPGRAEAMLKGTHVTRTRYAHQVTALSLSILRREAYTKYMGDCEESGEVILSFKAWCDEKEEALPQFKYWQTAYDMELLLLRFVRSIRVGDLNLYVKTLDEVVDWAFILDHYNYARWLPVHVRDLLNLPMKHPHLYRQFADGFFSIAKTCNPFSMIGFDHNHEQQNKELKMHGGTLNLNDECIFTEWSVAGPEVARVIAEFEAGMPSNKEFIPKHHDQSPSVQKRFAADTKALVAAFQDAGNPFDEDSDEIVILDTKEVMSESVAQSIMCAHVEGKKQHSAFVKERLESITVSFHEPIKMNKILLPSNPYKKQRAIKRIDSTKNDLHLLRQLYISLQVREGNADRLFEVENTDVPPSLSKHGKISGQKSDLVSCLEADSSSDFNEADVKLIDGASMVHRLKPDGSIKTFRDYAEKKVIPFAKKHLATAKRVDVIWDRYISDSLKATTRESRGAGVRQRLACDGNGKMPKNWSSYLRNETNKTELFQYLSGVITKSVFEEGKVVISTCDRSILRNPSADDTVNAQTEYPLYPCNHEEFDTRVLLHAANASSQGYNRILIIANDTDVIVLAISFFTEIAAEKLWVTFGIGKKLRYVPIHDICHAMSPTKAYALPAFHALTGCDNTSFFSGTGKKSAYAKWCTRPDLTTALCHLMQRPPTLSPEDIDVIESYVVLLYSITCSSTEVNQARQNIFAQSSRTFEYLPPTKAALIEHVKRVTYQAGYVWGQSLVANQVLPSPGSWGWTHTESGWVPFWTPLPPAAKALEELVSCGCTKSCAGKCSCYKRGLVCTARCKCGGNCYGQPAPIQH